MERSKLRAPTQAQIRAAREKAGLTQAQAAALVHAGSYRTWQDWEAGRRSMDLAAWELFQILAVLDESRRRSIVNRP